MGRKKACVLQLSPPRVLQVSLCLSEAPTQCYLSHRNAHTQLQQQHRMKNMLQKQTVRMETKRVYRSFHLYFMMVLASDSFLMFVDMCFSAIILCFFFFGVQQNTLKVTV